MLKKSVDYYVDLRKVSISGALCGTWWRGGQRRDKSSNNNWKSLTMLILHVPCPHEWTRRLFRAAPADCHPPRPRALWSV